MLGIGRKETDYVKEATQVVASLSTDVIATLPEVLQARLLHFPSQFEGEMRGVTRLVRVLQAGFRPYKLPPNYYVVEKERNFSTLFEQSPVRDLRFKPSLPLAISYHYREVTDSSNPFSRYVIASPEWPNFDPRARLGIALLPVVLVGYIPNNVNGPVDFEYTEDQFDGIQRQTTPGARVENGTGFLIAAVPPVNL